MYFECPYNVNARVYAPGSSMVTACRMVREGRAAGVISAGSTGAMLAASLLTMGRVKGVHRPGIAVPLPARDQPCVLIDAGANSESRPDNLLQFGMMGAVFAEEVLGIENPCVGLLSVGEESSKGTPEVVEAHALLSGSGLNFGGNCEGRDALSGRFQVLVADGFAGNVLLSFPVMVLFILVLNLLGQSGFNIIIAVTCSSAPVIMRIVRGLALDAKSRDYIQAAQTRGEHPLWIMLVELLPNVRGPIIVDSCLRLGYTTVAITTGSPPRPLSV